MEARAQRLAAMRGASFDEGGGASGAAAAAAPRRAPERSAGAREPKGEALFDDGEEEFEARSESRARRARNSFLTTLSTHVEISTGAHVPE